MTLDKHQFDGIGRITVKTLPTLTFEQLLLDAGYTKIGTAPAQRNRLKAGVDASYLSSARGDL